MQQQPEDELQQQMLMLTQNQQQLVNPEQQVLLVQQPTEQVVGGLSQVILPSSSDVNIQPSCSSQQLTVLSDGTILQGLAGQAIATQHQTITQNPQDLLVVLPSQPSSQLSASLPSVQIAGLQVPHETQSVIMNVPKGQGGQGISMSNAVIIQQAVAQVKAQQAKARAQQSAPTKSSMNQGHVAGRNVQVSSPHVVAGASLGGIVSQSQQVAPQRTLQNRPKSPKTPAILPKSHVGQAQMLATQLNKPIMPNNHGGQYIQGTPGMQQLPHFNRQPKNFNIQQQQQQQQHQQMAAQSLHQHQQHPPHQQHQQHIQQQNSPTASQIPQQKAMPGYQPRLQSPPRTPPAAAHGPSPGTDSQQAPDSTKGESLAGQTITVEAVECHSLQGQSRKLIKLVVSGAKGQAHSLLSKNAQLQSQILNMMQKAKTSTAEVSFPADPDQPIKITCKSGNDNKTPSGDANQKQPGSASAAATEGAAQRIGSPSRQGAFTRTPNAQNTGPTSHRAMTPRVPGPMAGQRHMAPGQQKLRSPPPSVMKNALQRGTPGNVRQPTGGKSINSNTQFIRNALEAEKARIQGQQMKHNTGNKDLGTAAQAYAARLGTPTNQSNMSQAPVARGTSSLQMMQQMQLQKQMQLSAVSTSNSQSPAATLGKTSVVSCSSSVSPSDGAPSFVQSSKHMGSIKVIATAGKDGSGDSPQKGGFVTGNEYTIECPNGKRFIAMWDGKYFKVKNPVSQDGVVGSAVTSVGLLTGLSAPAEESVKGGGGGDRSAQVKMLQGNPQALQTLGIAKPPESQPENPSTPNPEPEKAPTPPVRKRPPIPKQDGKFAVCENCGNLSDDYDICEGCKRPLPDEPRLFSPPSGQLIFMTNTSSPAANCTNAIKGTSASANLKAKQFYGNKLSEQLLLHQKAGPGRGRGGQKPKAAGRGRGRGRGKPLEPETVTILSSEDEEGDEGKEPASKQLRLDPSALLPSVGEGKPSRKLRMEDESGKIVAKKGPVTGVSMTTAAKTSEQKQGGNTVVKLVDPVIKLACHVVRVGSMQTSPVKNVEFSLKGFHMMLKLPSTGAVKIVEIRVEQKDILEVQVSFQRFLVMFIRVTQHCAAKIRSRFGPCVNNEQYFDPDSRMDCHRFITILMNNWATRDQEIFKAICKKLETDNMCAQPKILYPMLPDKANDLLVQASYVGVPKKKIVPGTQLITQTSSGLVTSQVVLNAGGLLTQVLVPQAQGSQLILALPGASQGHIPKLKTGSLNGDDEEEEPMDRSRSPSPILPSFGGPVIKLFTYPPAPAVGGISVTNEDLFCLNEGEFLNDVIIDFYLKYLFNEIFNEDDKERTHVFSSFFYRRLTQKQTRRVGVDDSDLTPQQKRHARVKTWTRHVDLFEKDFIIVPINESAHWYLAIICFPGLLEPLLTERMPSPIEETNNQSEKEKESPDQSNAENEVPKKEVSEEKASQPGTPQPPSAQDTATTSRAAPAADSNHKPEPATKGKMEKNIIQPCILIFDSLCGPGRTSVVRTLREYLQVEWDVKKGDNEGPRQLTKDNMKGAIPKCPQQTNFSDCGVYVLQYVESFFKNPISSFHVPLQPLNNWFSEDCIAQKREELRMLILDLQQELNPELDYDPASDGCLGISPSTMVTVPLSMEGATMPTPVITSVAGAVSMENPVGDDGAISGQLASTSQDAQPGVMNNVQEQATSTDVTGQGAPREAGYDQDQAVPSQDHEPEGMMEETPEEASMMQQCYEEAEQGADQGHMDHLAQENMHLQQEDFSDEVQTHQFSGYMAGAQGQGEMLVGQVEEVPSHVPAERQEEEASMDFQQDTDHVTLMPGGQSGRTAEQTEAETALAEADSTLSPCPDSAV